MHLSRSNQVVCFDDIDSQTKYFILHADPQIYAVISVAMLNGGGEGVQAWKPVLANGTLIDTKEISNFMIDICKDLRCCHIFANFKDLIAT